MTDIILHTTVYQQLVCTSKKPNLKSMTQKAVAEVLGLEMHPAEAKKMFRNIYVHLLQNDTRGLMQTLDYRDTLSNASRKREQYEVFKFMLGLLLHQNPKQLERLCPVHPHLTHPQSCPLRHRQCTLI